MRGSLLQGFFETCVAELCRYYLMHPSSLFSVTYFNFNIFLQFQLPSTFNIVVYIDVPLFRGSLLGLSRAGCASLPVDFSKREIIASVMVEMWFAH